MKEFKSLFYPRAISDQNLLQLYLTLLGLSGPIPPHPTWTICWALSVCHVMLLQNLVKVYVISKQLPLSQLEKTCGACDSGLSFTMNQVMSESGHTAADWLCIYSQWCYFDIGQRWTAERFNSVKAQNDSKICMQVETAAHLNQET